VTASRPLRSLTIVTHAQFVAFRIGQDMPPHAELRQHRAAVAAWAASGRAGGGGRTTLRIRRWCIRTLQPRTLRAPLGPHSRGRFRSSPPTDHPSPWPRRAPRPRRRHGAAQRVDACGAIAPPCRTPSSWTGETAMWAPFEFPIGSWVGTGQGTAGHLAGSCLPTLGASVPPRSWDRAMRP